MEVLFNEIRKIGKGGGREGIDYGFGFGFVILK